MATVGIGRIELARTVAAKLRGRADDLRREFQQPGRVRSFVVDDLLPEATARAIHAAFPDPGTMILKKSLREHKLVAAQMDRYAPILEEAIFCFQQREVLEAVSAITGIDGLEPDEHLYAGGISLMAQGHFLNPHLDNSHDKDRSRYRVLNLLFYVTPGWREEDGGNLELWDQGPKGAPRVVHSRFNRLVCMATDRGSWHSVQRVLVPARRCCVSNYYFAAQPPAAEPYFHVTSFRGRPEQPLRDAVLQLDIAMRQGLRAIFKKGVRENVLLYKRPPGGQGS